MKCQTLFPVKSKKNTCNLLSADLANKVKIYQESKKFIDIIWFYVHEKLFTWANKKVINLFWQNRIKVYLLENIWFHSISL